MNYMYLLPTGALICLKEEAKFDLRGNTIVKEALFSVSGNEDKFRKIENLRFSLNDVLADWKESD